MKHKLTANVDTLKKGDKVALITGGDTYVVKNIREFEGVTYVFLVVESDDYWYGDNAVKVHVFAESFVLKLDDGAFNEN